MWLHSWRDLGQISDHMHSLNQQSFFMHVITQKNIYILKSFLKKTTAREAIDSNTRLTCHILLHRKGQRSEVSYRAGTLVLAGFQWTSRFHVSEDLPPPFFPIIQCLSTVMVSPRALGNCSGQFSLFRKTTDQ